jgi:hypothetical protein
LFRLFARAERSQREGAGVLRRDSLFFIHSQHALRRPLPTLIEMFHVGCRVLGNVFAIHRKLERALQVFEV